MRTDGLAKISLAFLIENVEPALIVRVVAAKDAQSDLDRGIVVLAVEADAAPRDRAHPVGASDGREQKPQGLVVLDRSDRTLVSRGLDLGRAVHGVTAMAALVVALDPLIDVALKFLRSQQVFGRVETALDERPVGDLVADEARKRAAEVALERSEEPLDEGLELGGCGRQAIKFDAERGDQPLRRLGHEVRTSVGAYDLWHAEPEQRFA